MTTAAQDVVGEPLTRLLREVHDGRIQLPEFQRAVECDDAWIRYLLASVSLQHSIGAVMLLQAGSERVRFSSSPIAGAPAGPGGPERLLIDGQRRLSTLYRVLVSGRAVPTPVGGKVVERWYAISIDGALDAGTDRDTALVSMPAVGDKPRDDAEMTEQEWEAGLFPLRLACNDEGRDRWRQGYVQGASGDERAAKAAAMDRFEAEVIGNFTHYVVPVITVPQAMTRWSVRVHGGPDGPLLSDRFTTGRSGGAVL